MTTRSLVQQEDQLCIYRSVEGRGTRVIWELTSACNLKCAFCLVEIKRQHLPAAKALALADALADAGAEKVLLTGGEPLLHPAAEAIVRRLSARGVLVKLLTNGTIPAPALFDFIRASGTVEVSMSLPTVDRAEADRIFGADDTLARIEASLAALPLDRTNIICAVSTLNLAGVADVIDWVAARGIPCLSLTNIFKDPASPARFQDDCRTLAIDAGQRRQLFELVAVKRREHAGRLVIRTTQFVTQPGEHCAAGRSVFYMSPMGALMPCTVTDNAASLAATRGMGPAEAMGWYRANLPAVPASSCASRLAV